MVFSGRGHEALEAVAAALTCPSQDPLLATAVAPLRPYVMLFAGRPAQVADSFDTGELAVPGSGRRCRRPRRPATCRR
ncbi:hypothetical protein [Couchioplanes caeruleus]|uniref:Uncharacterized protein n=2 Tax=Couchioplanes caeruleus TaxID=56438 RepID=A0A1K0FQW1_9ACTN|nr:hypothetical protein [Couchioplanes caeruleus]OJF15072.1 hypothetical protein BG844_06360 [Couchioplanes caeruleus subsp. caeruleus]ROP33941.1 hypothetical protein EDD30_7001 [Couchioplanes caeruleus]